MGASLERSAPVRAATWADFAHVVDLLGRQSRAATGIAGTREEHVRTEWELPSFIVGRDNWLAGDSAYAGVSPNGHLTLAAADDATADALLDHVLARTRERGLKKLQLRPVPNDLVHERLLARHGFVLQTDVLAMWRALARGEREAEWPPGVTVRTFEPADARAVHALLDEAYGAWDRSYVAVPHEDWERAMTGDIEFDPNVWWIAVRDGAPAGVSLWWTSGWLKDLVVRESERGRGLGAALVQHGFAEFARRRVPRVGLKVDAANPTGAIRLYERLGFRTERREQIWALSL
jgi:ribosomal protein S18 acetylase RimI-like enzyme